MRKLLGMLLFAALSALAEEPRDRITISLQPLGDTDAGVVTRVTFRFTTPLEASDAELALQGSFLQNGTVVRNFRYVIPAQRPRQLTAVQTFAEGTTDVEVRLIEENAENDGPPLLLVKTAASLPVHKTGTMFSGTVEEGAESAVAEGLVPEAAGAVRILPPERDVAPNLFKVNVDARPPVTRVEFWVDDKKVMARNAPPYSVELDLGKLPKRVEVKAIGFDKANRYVDADSFLVNERDSDLEVQITRTETPDGVSHFKLSVQNAKGTNLRTVALFAGDEKLHEWNDPPYAIDLPSARLASAEFVRASAIDATGYEATDILFLDGRFMEHVDVNLVELPVSISDAAGNPVTDLTQKDFTILENGKPQTIASFHFASDLPISAGVLLDQSGSMDKRMDAAKSAAVSFFRRILKKDDRAFISAFASDTSRIAPFVSEVATLESQVRSLPDAQGGTALYDAIITGLYRFRNVQGRKALIIITDGKDTVSRMSYDDMLAYARGSRVPLYFVGIGFLLADGRMKTLAAETGGVAYFVRHVNDLPDAYRKLEADLRSQYLVTYQTESSKLDTDYRTVEVKVDRPDARVRTIRGYLP